jgi:hypothetical protein
MAPVPRDAHAAVMMTLKRPPGNNLDTPSISTVIAGPPICRDCIADKVGLSPAQMDGILKSMASAIPMTVMAGRCEVCEKQATLFHRA